jgi:dTMP kinase
VAFSFDVPLDVALGRILAGRPQLKYYEAGMDLGLSVDPYESFAQFQDRIRHEYAAMIDEFDLAVIDATLPIAQQQQQHMRELVRPHQDGVLRTPVATCGGPCGGGSLGPLHI